MSDSINTLFNGIPNRICLEMGDTKSMNKQAFLAEVKNFEGLARLHFGHCNDSLEITVILQNLVDDFAKKLDLSLNTLQCHVIAYREMDVWKSVCKDLNEDKPAKK